MAVASILVASACGSSGSSGPALTKQAYVTQGNAICAATAKQIKSAAATVFPNPSQAGWQDPDHIKTFATRYVIPDLQKEHDELQALKAPSQEAPYVHTMLDEFQTALNRWAADKTLMSAVQDRSFAQFDSLANDYGLTSCSPTDGMIRSITSGEPFPTS